jgi:histidine triad (HIT) family protein
VPPIEPKSDCVFCHIAAGHAPAERLYEDDSTVAFMDINPATDGHCLVIPKRHSDDIWSLDEEDGAAVWRTVHRVARIVREALDAKGVNLLQASGRAAFQSVFHYHVHVIPRYSWDDVHLPWIPRAGDPDRLGEAAARLRTAIDQAREEL